MNNRMRDKLVVGCADGSEKEMFFKENYSSFTFQKTVDICSVYQSAKRQMAARQETEEGFQVKHI